MGVRSEMNPKREIYFSTLSGIVDAFNRLRVSSPRIIFDSQLQYGKQQTQWFEQKSTSATITALSSEATVELSITGGTINATRQSREYITYQPGHSQLVFATFADAQSATFVEKYIGYGDDNNGIFFKSDGDGYYFVKRSDTTGAVVDTEIAQASWNIDRLDSTGPSRFTMDFTKAQFLVIDLEWLGIGRVRCGFVLDGIITYAHEFLQANVGTEPYMRRPSLPVRYHIVGTTSATGTNTLKQVCAAVMSEGGDSEPAGEPRTVSNEVSLVALTCSTTPVDIISIRPRTTFLGLENRIHIALQGVEVFAEDADIHYHIKWGGVSNSSSAGWTAVSTAWSSVEYTTAGTLTTGGLDVMEGYVAASEDKKVNFAGAAAKSFAHNVDLALDIGGGHPTVTANKLTDQLTITAQTLGTDSDVAAVLSWVEDQ